MARNQCKDHKVSEINSTSAPRAPLEAFNPSGQTYEGEHFVTLATERSPPLGPASWPRYADLPLTYHSVPDISWTQGSPDRAHRAPIRHHSSVALAQDAGDGRIGFPISSSRQLSYPT